MQPLLMFFQVVITFFILALFLVELGLRQVAKGRRFWKSVGNIFDFVVIWVTRIPPAEHRIQALVTKCPCTSACTFLTTDRADPAANLIRLLRRHM